ncbi:trichohyalin-like [Macrobrachium nipponense]|uniref:trichohyalin-like n=1 Tax=Macrobrachium nipponense TaxID=159736 RepID=UPI0030C8AACF
MFDHSTFADSVKLKKSESSQRENMAVFVSCVSKEAVDGGMTTPYLALNTCLEETGKVARIACKKVTSMLESWVTRGTGSGSHSFTAIILTRPNHRQSFRIACVVGERRGKEERNKQERCKRKAERGKRKAERGKRKEEKETRQYERSERIEERQRGKKQEDISKEARGKKQRSKRKEEKGKRQDEISKRKEEKSNKARGKRHEETRPKENVGNGSSSSSNFSSSFSSSYSSSSPRWHRPLSQELLMDFLSRRSLQEPSVNPSHFEGSVRNLPKQEKWPRSQNEDLGNSRSSSVIFSFERLDRVERKCIEDQKALQIGQDATARKNDDHLYYATEMISLLKEEWKDAKEENYFLLDELEELNFNEAATIRTNQDLLDEFMEERHNERQCESHREKLEELQNQAVDNDFYCGYLEEKVKAHETERKRLLQATAQLEEKLQFSQREVSGLTRNHDLDKNLSNQTRQNLGNQKNAHIQETPVQPLPKENEKMNDKLEQPERPVTVLNNSMANDKNKNDALVEENKVKGNMLYKLGRLEEASECFLKILDMDDDQVDIRLRLGLCLLLLGRHSEAVMHLEKLDNREDLVAAAKALQRLQRHGCPYYILGIAEEASLKEIEWAYRKRALKFNPDKCHGSNEERQRRTEIMQKVNYANDLLHDVDEREEYDTVREFIKDLAAAVFLDPQETMKAKRKKPGRTRKRTRTKGN